MARDTRSSFSNLSRRNLLLYAGGAACGIGLLPQFGLLNPRLSSVRSVPPHIHFTEATRGTYADALPVLNLTALRF